MCTTNFSLDSSSVHDEENLAFLKEKIKLRAVKSSCKDGKLYTGGGGFFEFLFAFHDFFVDPEALDAFAIEFWGRYKEYAPLQIGGIETSGIPLVVAVLQKAKELNIDATGFFIRKQRKTRALCRIIDGDLNDNPIVIVDDAFKSGSTMDKARVSVESVGKNLSHICTMIDFQWNVGKKWLKDNNIIAEFFFTNEDFDIYQDSDSSAETFDRRKVAQIKYELLWHFAAPDPMPTIVCPKSTPLLAADKLYFGSDSGIFWSLNATSGEVSWSYNTRVHNEKGILSSPAYYNNRVYFGAYNGNIYCLDANTGGEIWVNPACEWIGSSPLILPEKNTLVIGLEYSHETKKGGMAALDLATGDMVWEHTMSRYQHGSASYWEDGNLVICGSSDYTLLALDADNGKVIWELPTNRSIKYPPAICTKRGIVAAGSHDGFIRIAALNTGELLYETETSDICYSTPLIVGKYLFCGSSDRYFYIVNLDTYELEKCFETRGRIFSSPALIDGNVIFGNNAGVLEEINAETLATESAIMFADPITNKIAISPNESTIFVPTYMNEIFALKRTRKGKH